MDPYLGEIRLFAGRKEPADWAFCDGRLLTIQSRPELFAVLGVVYGGDGVTNFALPDLRGRLPVGYANAPPAGMQFSYPLGSAGGTEVVTLTAAQLPAHTHAFNASTLTATSVTPGPSVVYAATSAGNGYVVTSTFAPQVMSAAAVSVAGGNSGHENRMPSLTLNYIIALIGIFPTQG